MSGPVPNQEKSIAGSANSVEPLSKLPCVWRNKFEIICPGRSYRAQRKAGGGVVGGKRPIESPGIRARIGVPENKGRKVCLHGFPVHQIGGGLHDVFKSRHAGNIEGK